MILSTLLAIIIFLRVIFIMTEIGYYVISNNEFKPINLKNVQANILAYDDQGNCESWIDGTLAGIVWHPERMKEPWIPAEIEHLLAK